MSGPLRLDFLAWLLDQEGKPYLYGAKGPDAFDCSGLVTAGLLAAGGPDWRETHSAHVLSNVLPHVEVAQPGDLAAYGPPGLADHVMVVYGDGRVFGASGGDRSTTSLRLAAARGACVHWRPSVSYRRDFRYFLQMPLF